LKITGAIVIALALLITLTGIVTADQVVPQVSEVQGITTSTVIICEGIVMDSASLGWTLTGGNDLATRSDDESYMLDPQQVQYSTTYDASTIAQGGQTTFIKTMAIGTGNKLITQSNVKANTEVTFMATENGGNILGTENIMIDGTAMATPASDRILCPFGDDQGNVIPAYCNIVQAGSRYDLTIGSVVTSADNRFVGSDATAPVVLNYAINVKPYTVAGMGTSPAMGSVSAYVKASIKEGRSGYNYLGSMYPDDETLTWQQMEEIFETDAENVTPSGPAGTLTYSESSSASGIITSFSKVIAYQSGKSLMP